MTRLQMLTAVRRGLTNPKNFNPLNPRIDRPHCVIGEIRRVNKNPLLWDTADWHFTFIEMAQLMRASITHPQALSILDAAIKREKKRLARERSR